MSTGFINCNVIPLAGRSKTVHGILVEDGEVQCLEDYDRIMRDSGEKIDLKGCTVLPGFIDSHTHLVEMGLKMGRTDLSETSTLKEAKYYLEKDAEEKAEGEWIIGVDFDDTKWKKTGYPSKEDLDDVSEAHPIIATRICGHIAVANSMALERIDEDWEDVDHETGVMKERPVWNLDEVIDISKEDRIQAIEKGVEEAHTLGVTGIHDIVDRSEWEAFVEYDEEKDLKLRTRCYLHFDESEGLEPMEKSDFLALRGLKLFADGSLGGHTAALHEEYEDDPGNKGRLLLDSDDMGEIIEDAEARGFQVMVHTIGDRAIDHAIDAFENSAQRTKELRHRLEHVEMLWDENIKGIRRCGLNLSVQPNFAYKWSQPGGMNESRLGKERLEKCDPFWDVQRALIKMAFGSDTMPMSPLFGVYSATNHPLLGQRISTYNALQSYISNGAYLSRDEKQFGELSEGKSADFVVLSEDPLDAEDIRDVNVMMTVVDGEIVYDDFEDR